MIYSYPPSFSTKFYFVYKYYLALLIPLFLIGALKSAEKNELPFVIFAIVMMAILSVFFLIARNRFDLGTGYFPKTIDVNDKGVTISKGNNTLLITWDKVIDIEKTFPMPVNMGNLLSRFDMTRGKERWTVTFWYESTPAHKVKCDFNFSPNIINADNLVETIKTRSDNIKIN